MFRNVQNLLKKHGTIFLFLLIIIGYFVISPFIAFSYDDSFYFQYFRWVYLYGVQPYFIWVFGAYYNTIMVGAYLLNVPFYFAGFDNVLVQEFTFKLPLILSSGVAAYGISEIISKLRPSKRFSLTPGIIFLIFPLMVFYIPTFGNPLIVALMFLVLSVVFLLRSKPGFSSLFMAAAAATYLYPVFFILPLLKVIDRRFGRKETERSLLIILLGLFIGQGIPLIAYYATGIPFSVGSILAPFYSVSSSITFTSNQFAQWGPYFIPQAVFNYNTPPLAVYAIFALSMLIPMILFLVKKIGDDYFIPFIEFLFVDSLMFSIFAFVADPQYLQVIIPFALILFYLKRSSFYLNFSILASLLSTFQFFLANKWLLILFQNISPSWNRYQITFPPGTEALVDSLYLLSLSILLFLHLIYRQNTKTKKEEKGSVKRWEKTQLGPNAYTRYGTLLLTFTIIAILFVAIPASDNPPNFMYWTAGSDIGSSNGITLQASNVSDVYVFQAPLPWSISNNWTREHSEFKLYLPETTAVSNSSCTLSFNSRFVGNVSFSSSELVPINVSLVKSYNFLVVHGLYRPNGPVQLVVYLPLQVPPKEILQNYPYFLLGILFASIDILGFVFILIRLSNKDKKGNGL